MAHFPAFFPLINDMINKNTDREHFTVTYATITFDVIISLDVLPYEILIGGQGINWACIMEIFDDLEIAMPDHDFYALRNALNLKASGIEKFGSYIFLRYISEHAPKICSGKPVQPTVMQRWYPNRTNAVDPEKRTIFYRWVDQNKSGRLAHDFEKTETYFGKNVADYCRRHNCQTAHCGRHKPHFDFGENTASIVPHRHLPQALRRLTADCLKGSGCRFDSYYKGFTIQYA